MQRRLVGIQEGAALAWANKLKAIGATLPDGLGVTEQALICLARAIQAHRRSVAPFTPLPATIMTARHTVSALRKEVRRLRTALNAQSQRLYAQARETERLRIVALWGVRRVKQASNSVPCSLRHCGLCTWVRDTQFACGSINSTTYKRLRKSHSMECHLGEDMDDEERYRPAGTDCGGAGGAGAGVGVRTHGADSVPHP